MLQARNSRKSTSSRLLLSLLFFPFLGWALLYAAGSIPYGAEGKAVIIEVKRGEPFSRVARELSDRGVISSATLFTLWARLWGSDRKLGWGHYRFELPLSSREVLDQLVLGKGAFRRVTIPEGLTVKEIAELLEKNGLADKKVFLAQAANPETLSLLGLDGAGVEGYLFPNTYHFAPATSEIDILKTMVGQFRLAFTDAMQARARELGFTPHEVVTLASLIEKETGIDSERPLVSAVFQNRLKRNMPLQSDPTVIYGLKNFSGDLTRKDLRTKTPYNTYLIPRLPPTPICNPGLPSIQAALYPAAVPALYFVSKNDGSHVFSATLKEHNRAVSIYQKTSSSQPNHARRRAPATRRSRTKARKTLASSSRRR